MALAGLALFLQDLLDQAGADRVQAGERLVDDDQIRLVQEGGDDLRLLLHALAQLLNLLVAMLGQLEPFQPAAQTAASHPLVHPLEGGQVDEGGVQPGVFVQPSLFGHVADAPFLVQVEPAAENS